MTASLATCGTCGRSWDPRVTPTPAARCPYEYDHEPERGKLMPDRTSRYSQRHFQDLAALLSAEREQNGPSPALNRITAAVTRLFAEDNANFNRELFGKAARGKVSPTARPRQRQARFSDEYTNQTPTREQDGNRHAHRYDGQTLTHEHNDGNIPHGYYEHPEDVPSDRSELHQTREPRS